MKHCKKCGEDKSLDHFYVMNAARDGHRPECKACTAAQRKRWYETNRAREIERVAEWQRANPERHRESQRRRRQDPDVKRRERGAYLVRKYGITLDQYDEMFEAQGGTCGICGRLPTPGISLHVDHDHETGAVRGLTCFRCNNALGDFGHDVERLREAIAYLDSHDPEARAMADVARERVLALRR